MSGLASRPVSRRRFLAGTAAAGLVGIGRPSVGPRYAFATPGDPSSGDVLVVVFLRGGADGLSLVPPFSDGGYQAKRGAGTGNDVAVPPPSTAVPADTAIDLGATNGGHHFGLHPAMTGLGRIWDDGHLALVHAVGLPSGTGATRSHFEAQAHSDRGTTEVGVPTGWLARHAAAAGLSGSLASVSIDTGLAPSLWGAPRAVAMADVSDFGVSGFHDAAPALEAMSLLYPDGSGDALVQQGADTLAAVDLVVSTDPAQYDQNAGLYPSAGPGERLGRGLFDVARLVRAQVGLRVATVDMGGWDHHDAMGPVSGGTMRQWAQGLSDALAAFHDDLGPLMDGVTVVVMSEFGRTNEVNGSNGTDHGRGGAMFVMSGHAVPGVHGHYPPGPLTDGPEGDLAVTTDFRAVLAEVLAVRGDTADLGAVFPGFTHPGHLGLLSP